MKFIPKIKLIKIDSIIKHPLFWVVLASFVLRVSLTSVNLPFIFHPDEPTVVHSTQNLKYSLNPKHFDWPNLYYYLNAPFFFFLETSHALFKKIGLEDLASLVVDRSAYFVMSRVLTAFFGALTSITIYKIVKNITLNRHVAILSSVLIALTPFHMTRSAQALTDVPMLFFLTVSVYFLTRNFQSEKKWNYYFSFFFAGLAISTKYNAYLIFPTLLGFILWIRPFRIKDVLFYAKCGFLTLLGFFIGTPFALLDFKTFIRSDSYVGVLWQFTNVGKVGLMDQIYFFFVNTLVNLPEDFGFLLYYLTLAFIVYFVVNLRNKTWSPQDKFLLILVFQFFYFIWVVSGLRIQRTHYFITLYFIPPILTSILIYRFKFLEKFTILFQAFFVLYISFQLLYPSVHLQLFHSLKVDSKMKDVMFFSAEERATVVLKKLDVPNSKMNNSYKDKLKKFNYLVTDRALCSESSECDYLLVKSYWDFNGGILNIYEIIK